MKADAVVQYFLQRVEPRGRELALPLKFLHRPVTGPRWNDDAAFHANVESEPYRFLGPVDSLFFVEKWRPHEDKRPDGNVVFGKEPRRRLEVGERHAFVQARQHFGVYCLQPHRNLKCRPELVAQGQTALVDEPWMALDDDGLQGSDQVGDARPVDGRDRLGVKEVAGVVELDMPRGR